MSLSVAMPLAASRTFTSTVASRFSRAARRYDDYASVQQQVAEAAIAGYAWQSDDTVLDIGAGTGCNTQQINNVVACAMGVDLSAGMVEEATSRYPALTFVEGDAGALPFASAQFSVVFSSMALQWCQSPATVLSEITRVLTPGGKAVLAIMVDGSFADLKSAQHAAGLDSTLMPLTSSQAWLTQCQASALTVNRVRHVGYTAEFDDVLSLLRSITRVGASTRIDTARAMTRGDVRRLDAAYQHVATAQNKLPLSYQLLHIHLEKA